MEKLNEYIFQSTSLPAVSCDHLESITFLLILHLPRPPAPSSYQCWWVKWSYWCTAAAGFSCCHFVSQCFRHIFQNFVARYCEWGFKEAAAHVSCGVWAQKSVPSFHRANHMGCLHRCSGRSEERRVSGRYFGTGNISGLIGRCWATIFSDDKRDILHVFSAQRLLLHACGRTRVSAWRIYFWVGIFLTGRPSLLN